MPRPRVVYRQEGWRAMFPSNRETAAPDLVWYAVNMLPTDPVQGGSYVRRADDQSASVGSADVLQHLGLFDLRAGALVVAVADGEIYTMDQTSGVWTRVVTDANFVTAAITVSATARIRAVTFNDLYVMTDGVNPPFTWDGTSGATGLAELDNAPSKVYGQPVVYYAKLFFIKDVAASNADRSTIVWSEENQPNVGYEATIGAITYNNAWTLGQTGGAPLVALAATNDALYYFRQNSAGAIRGAVTSDFQAAGVHDNLSETTGTASPDGVTLYDDVLYFCDAGFRAWRKVPGGIPQQMPVGALVSGPMSQSVNAPFSGTYPNSTGVFWCPVPFYRAVLLYHPILAFGILFSIDTGLPLCSWNGTLTATMGTVALATLIGSSVPVPTSLLGGGTSGAATRLCPGVNNLFSAAPGFATALVEFGPFSAGPDSVSHFSTVDAVLVLGDDGLGGAAAGTDLHTVSSSEVPDLLSGYSATVASFAMPAPSASTHTGVRRTFGISRELRKLRYKVSMTSFPNPGWGVQRIAVTAYPVTAGPGKAT